MNLKTLIVDDEAPARRRMAQLLREEPDCELLGQAENGAEAIELIRSLRPNLVLLDIQLKDKTGFEVMQAVGSEYQGTLIFITAFDEHAIQAFEINAIDYLLKPYKTSRFKEAVERARRLLSSRQQPSMEELLQQLVGLPLHPPALLRIPEGKIVHHLDGETLEHIRADGSYCRFYTAGNSKTIRISLKEVAALLEEPFVRISRSVIINRRKIRWTKKLKHSMEVELESGVQFSVSRDYFYLNL